MLEKYANLINGEWLQGSGRTLVSDSPANNKKLWQGNMVNTDELGYAIKSCQQAFKHWCMFDIKDRIRILKKFQDKLKNNLKKLALTISMENGKPLWEAISEVNSVISKIDISIEAHFSRCVELDNIHNNCKSVINYKPIGIFAVLGPFNFPAHLPFGHIIPAILAGNCVVFKPSELTPLVAKYFIEYLANSGLPAGVVNLIQGDHKIGESLVCSEVNGVLFTGGYETGKKIHKLNAGQPWKVLALEMGGNNPLVISKAKDLLMAADVTLISAFISSGQRCSCARRVILTSDVDQPKFISILTDKIKQIRIGTYDQSPEPFMGPLINQQAVKGVIGYLDKLVGLGASVLLAGNVSQKNPTIITPSIVDVSKINIPDHECFGPILQVIRVADLDDAIIEANNTKYGLASSILTDDQDEFIKFRDRINAGIVNWNMPTTGALSRAPFGGIGKSGNFRPGAYFAADYCSYPFAGMYTMDKFTHSFPGI